MREGVARVLLVVDSDPVVRSSVVLQAQNSEKSKTKREPLGDTVKAEQDTSVDIGASSDAARREGGRYSWGRREKRPDFKRESWRSRLPRPSTPRVFPS